MFSIASVLHLRAMCRLPRLIMALFETYEVAKGHSTLLPVLLCDAPKLVVCQGIPSCAKHRHHGGRSRAAVREELVGITILGADMF